MNSSELKHLRTRVFVACFIISIFIVYSIFTDNNSKSCIGNPSILPFAFIGFPLLILLTISDIIYLLILKKLTKNKLVINLSIVVAYFFIVFLVGNS